MCDYLVSHYIIEAARGQQQREETFAICKRIGLKIDDDLQQKVQMYCKAMIEQEADTLKKMYLPAIFTPSEMSGLW